MVTRKENLYLDIVELGWSQTCIEYLKSMRKNLHPKLPRDKMFKALVSGIPTNCWIEKFRLFYKKIATLQ